MFFYQKKGFNSYPESPQLYKSSSGDNSCQVHFQLPALISKVLPFQHLLAPSLLSNIVGKIKVLPTTNVTIWSCTMGMRKTEATAFIIQVKNQFLKINRNYQDFNLKK